MFVATNKKNKSMGFNISGSSSKYGFKTIPNESVSWRLQSADGKYFGDVSYGAYKAVESGTLDSYKAKNEAEKKILDEVKSYIGWKEPEESKSLVITDYRPGTNNMSKNEYLRRQKSNPDMPEFGSYEYFKNREEYLRPIIDEIADDADRYNDTYKAWAENYAKDNTWAEGKPVQKLAKKLYEKFKYQDAILAEYKDIDAQLKKFDKKGIHYDNALEIDTESGAAEAKYAKERLDAIVNATTFTNDEMVLGVYGELPKDKQKEYDNVRVVAGKRNVEAEKEKAYNYYDKNKDNVYKDDLWGRITGNYKIGRISIKTNDAGYTSYKASTDDVEAAEVYQALSSRIQKQNNATFQNNGAAEEITAIVAQYAPQGVDQALYKAGGSLVGAVIGAASGAGAAATARAGGSAAVAGYMYRQTAGAAFVRLLQESNLSVKDAKTLANSEALASSAVEFGLDYVTSGLWKGVGSATKNATSELGEKTMKALMSKGISEKGAKTIISVAKNAGKLTVDALGEGTEEWIQEGMSITADKYAAEGKTASAFKLFTKSFDLTQYSKEDFSRMNQSFLAGTIIGFGHGGLNAATSLGINKTVSAAAGAVDAKVLGEEINKSGETKIITDAVEMAKDNVSPEVVRAVETVETAIAEDNTPPAEAVGTVVKSVLTDNAVQETAAETEHVKNEMEETTASVSVGDTFKDTKTGNTITVVERDANSKAVEIDTGTKIETRKVPNTLADTLATNEQFEQMESSEVFSPEDAQPVTSINEQNMHVSTENTTENASLTNTDVTKEDNFPEAFKLDENGKIRFNQVGINYDNQNYREGNFNVLAQGGIETKNIKGGIVGKYGVHKKDNGYFGVTLLSSGMDIAAFSTFDEALSFATYTNKEVAFNDIFYVRNAEGILTIDATSEFMKYGEQIKAIKSEKAYLQTAKDAETSETVTSINSENMPVTDQNITDNDTVTNTNVSKAEVAESGINSQKAEEIAPVSDYIVRETENSETPVAVKNTTADANTSLETKAATSKTSETPADNNKTMTKTDKKVAVEKSIAKKKKTVTKQNKTKITDFSDFPKVEDTLKEGQTLTLKHTKNLHTVFKDATRVAVGKDVITDGYIAIPRSDEAVSKIKKVVDESIIQYGDLTFEKIYEKDNDVVISGVPKITDKIINGKKEKVYVFKIGNEFYTCQQKHLDALNYGNNAFVANKDANSVWTVKDENGEVIAAIVPAFKKGSISDEIYDRLDSVADVINAKNLKKAKIAQATLSQEEMNYFGNGNALVTVNVDGVPFLCNNYLLLRTDEYTIDLMKEEYERDITLNESFAERAATMFSQDIIGDVTKTANADVYKTDYNGKVAISEKTGKPIVEKSLTACLADDTPFCFDTKMFNMLDKASDSLKIIKFTDSLETSALIGFDESGEVVGYLCPVRESANTAVEIDGKQYKYYTKGSIDEKMADTAETDDLKNEEKSAIIEKDKKAFSETDEAVSSVSEYTKDMKPMQKGKVEKALNAPYQTKEYGLLTYADFMERSIADGRQLEERRDLKAKVRNGRNDFDFVKDVEASYNRNKAKYNEIGVNDFALAKEARELRENKTGGKYIMSVDQELYYYLTGDESVLPESCFDKTYCVMLSDNQFYSVPKTAYDYGKWLVANDADVSFSLEDIKSSKEIEKGVSNDERRNNVTARSVGRSVSESADKSGGSLYEAARESEENGGQRTDTESSRRIYAENVRAVQGTEVRQQGAFRCEFINPEYYTDDMRAIAESNAKKGIKTYFFFGDGRAAFCPDARFRGAIRKNEVYIQCDHARYSPEQINKHELVHKNYKSEDVQKVREYINNNLTEEEKRYIINVMYSHYAQQCKGDVNKVFEEFVCDVLSGINSCGGKFADITQEYWSKHTDLIDSYSAADYSDSTDAGGVSLSSQRESILYEGQPMYSLNKGTDKIRYSPQGLRIPGAEYHKFIRAVGTDYYNKNKTHSGLQYQSVVGSNDHILYVYEDYGFDNYKIVGRVDYADVETANKVMELIDNGETIEITELVSEVSEWLKARQSSYSIYNAYTKKRRSSRGVHSVSAKQSRSIARGTDGSSGRDAENGRADDISFSLEDDGEFDLFDLWEQKNKEFGTIKKGENPTRDIDVPKKITKEKLVSQFARTMLEAGVTPDTAVSEFEKRVLDGTMTHEVITNDSARQWAINQIKYHGFEEAMNTWSVYTRDGNVGKKELALGMELYNQCITSGDVTNAMRIAAELVAEATHAGQTLQATRMLKLMTPDGQLYYLEKSIQKMNDEFKKKIGEKYEDIELNEDLMEKFLTEKDADKRDEIYDDICQDIADQIPATLLDKWNSWRYLAMLGNPRTHIRNIAGNVVFTPAIKLKNYIGAIIERLARVDESKRTKSMHKSKEAVEFAKKDFSKMQKVLQGENAKYAVTSDIEGKRTIFKTKWLEALRNKNFEWLEKEDMWFLKRRYVDALAQIITARKLDVDSIDEKTLDIARAYAVREAQRATFRDANALAEALNKLQKKASHSDKKAVRAASVLIEGVMPFKKTPLNIAKQGVQYSPVGILTGVYKTVAKAKNGDMYSTTDIIDDFAKGLTGTAIMLLGTLLASLGIVSGGDDENKKKKEFDKMVGEQSFSLNIGDSSYTIDWMTPACLPLFTGVELYELTKDDFKFADIVNALSSLTDPLLELSVFSGISGAIESAQYNDTNTLFAIGSDMTTSYLTQALPTIGGQLSRIIDKNKREYYYTDKNSNLPKGVQNFIGQVSSKIPFASYLFEPSIDEWGREETYGSIVERTLENAVSPGYYSEKNYTEVDEEIKRLYESTGEADVLPVTQQKKYTESKVDYPMTAAQWTEAKRIRGQKSFELIEQLFSDKMQVKLQNKETGEYQEMFYSQMSDEEKIRAIINCYEDARDYTKEQMLDKVKSNRKK